MKKQIAATEIGKLSTDMFCDICQFFFTVSYRVGYDVKLDKKNVSQNEMCWSMDTFHLKPKDDYQTNR